MLDKESKHRIEPVSAAGFRAGCPVCERTDPQLDRELQAFAQLLFDIHIAQGAERSQTGTPTAD
jgi:hypothetical protein